MMTACKRQQPISCEGVATSEKTSGPRYGKVRWRPLGAGKEVEFGVRERSHRRSHLFVGRGSVVTCGCRPSLGSWSTRRCCPGCRIRAVCGCKDRCTSGTCPKESLARRCILQLATIVIDGPRFSSCAANLFAQNRNWSSSVADH